MDGFCSLQEFQGIGKRLGFDAKSPLQRTIHKYVFDGQRERKGVFHREGTPF